VVFMSTNLFTLIFASYKLVRFIQYRGGFQPSIAKMCLVLCIIDSTIRFLLAIDPQAQYDVYDYSTALCLITLSGTFTFASSFLIAVYWHNIYQKSKRGAKTYKWIALIFSDRMFLIAEIVVCSLIIIAGIFDAGLRTAWVEPLIFLVFTAVVYMFFCFIIGVYFLYSTYMLLRVLSKNVEAKTKKMAIFTTINGICLLILFVLLLLYATSLSAYIPVFFAILDFSYFTALTTMTVSEIMIFKTPTGEKTSSTGSGKNSSTPAIDLTTPQNTQKEEENSAQSKDNKEEEDSAESLEDNNKEKEEV